MKKIDLSPEQIAKIKAAALVKREQMAAFLKNNPKITIPYPVASKLPLNVAPWQEPESDRDLSGAAYRIVSGKQEGMTVIVSPNIFDNQLWYHASISHTERMPTYADLCFLKKWFIGPDRWAIQVFVPEDEHVNIHTNALHLWHCITGDRPFPRFDCGLGSI